MDFLRNKEVRLQIMLCIGVTVIGSVLSYFFCMKFYWITFLTGCTITVISLILTYQRYIKISSLSQVLIDYYMVKKVFVLAIMVRES